MERLCDEGIVARRVKILIEAGIRHRDGDVGVTELVGVVREQQLSIPAG